MNGYKIKYLNEIPAFKTIKKELKGLPGLGEFSKQWFRTCSNFLCTKICTPRTPFMFYFWICCLVLNETSQQAKKIGKLSTKSLAMIIIGGWIIRSYTYQLFNISYSISLNARHESPSSGQLDSPIQRLQLDSPIQDMESPSSRAIGFAKFVTVCLFILDSLLILAILSSLNRLHKLKMPKLYLRTPNDSLESNNGPKYTPLIYEV